MSLIRRYLLVAFFVLAYALSWILESPLVFLGDTLTDTQGFVLTILASNVPSLLAVALTAIVYGRGALRRLLGRLLSWRVEPRWHLVVVLGPVALAGGVVALNTLVGGPPLSFDVSLLIPAVITLGFSIFPGSALGGRGRVAGVRPAPSASRKECSKRQPHSRADLGFVAPTAVLGGVVAGSTWSNSHPLRRFRGLGLRVERHPHLGVHKHRG
jgi:hypothetical protein